MGDDCDTIFKRCTVEVLRDRQFCVWKALVCGCPTTTVSIVCSLLAGLQYTCNLGRSTGLLGMHHCRSVTDLPLLVARASARNVAHSLRQNIVVS